MKFSALRHCEPGSPEERHVFLSALVFGILLVVLDQVSKWLVVENIGFCTLHPVIPGFFDLTYITNKGAAWGLFRQWPWFPMSISLIVFFLAIAFFRKLCEGWPERCFAVAMILSGIVGNCTDRICRGAVVDFLRLYWRDWAWPSFNVADSAICCGVFLFILSAILRPERKKHDESDRSGDS